MLPPDVHVVGLETTTAVPFESLSLPLWNERRNAAVAVAVAVVVYTLLPQDLLLAVAVNTLPRPLWNQRRNAGLTLELLLPQELLLALAVKTSTATTSLLFADASFVDDELKDHVIADPRQARDENVMDEINEVVTEFAPDIYVRPALIKTKHTDWQLVADDWEEGSRKYIPLQKVNASLYTAYDGCLTTLRRLTPCKSILNLFLVRIPRCKQNSTRYCVNQANRADIAHTIFALLAKEKAPFIVIGNLGFALASCLRFLWQFEEKTGIKLEDQLQIVYSQDQELVCIFKNEEGQSIQQRIFSETPECLCIDISWTGSVVSQHAPQTGGMSSGVKQSTEHTKRVGVTLKSRREHY